MADEDEDKNKPTEMDLQTIAAIKALQAEAPPSRNPGFVNVQLLPIQLQTLGFSDGTDDSVARIQSLKDKGLAVESILLTQEAKELPAPTPLADYPVPPEAAPPAEDKPAKK